MRRPEGLLSIDEVLRYLEQDRFFTLKAAAVYLSMQPRKLQEILPPQFRFKVSCKKILIKKSELDEFMERFRERPQKDLGSIVDDVVEAVLGK